MPARPSALVDMRVTYCGEMDFMDEWYPPQVGRPDVDAFEAVTMREDRMLADLFEFEFTGDALFAIDRFRRKEGLEIKPLTVR